jgi:hypothetical protein
MGSISAALNQPFYYDSQSQPLPLKSRVALCFEKFSRKHMQEIAATAGKVLSEMPRISPRDALNSNELPAFNRFLKQAKPIQASKEFKTFEIELIAYKLGISSKALKANEGFEAFAKQTRIWQYLSIFDHSLKEGEGGSLEVMHEGTLKPWSEVKDIALEKGIKVAHMPDIYNPALKYRQSGIANDTYYNWTELKPFKKEENHAWGNRYIVELCALAGSGFRLFGDHSWIRLKTPEGDIYSFGIYREDNFIASGLSVKQADIQSPDVSEFWPEKIHTIAFEIKQEQFQAIKAKVEQDKKTGVIFHVVEKNCSTYAVEILESAGIKLIEKGSVAGSFLPRTLYQKVYGFFDRIKGFPKKITLVTLHIIQYPLAILFNLAFLFLGGRKVSDKAKGARPLFEKFTDLLKTKAMYSYLPFSFAYVSKPKIENARKNLNPYAIPPEV